MSDPTPTLRPEALPEIPGYEVLGQAGRGGMGAVYRAQQISTHRTVALKLLGRPGEAKQADLAQFRGEAEVVARLEHPHIVPLYDSGEVQGAPYLAMRYLSGGTVADRLVSGPIPPPQALGWLRAMAEAIDFAHNRGLIHRDIKPSNMLLDEAGQAYLADFGIAGALKEAGEGLPTGSAAYMSPEQGQGRPAGPSSDTYALAVTAFEMLTGRKPYASETALGTIVRHVEDPIPSARVLNQALPQAVDRALAHGMAKRPEDRPPTAAALVDELAWALAQPVQAPAEARPRRRLSPWIWLAGLGVLAVGGMLVVGAGVAGYAFLSRPEQATPTSTRPPTQAPNMTVAPTQAGLPLTDDFSDPKSGFAVRDIPDGQVVYADGRLLFRVRSTGVAFVSNSGRLDEPDVSVQATFEQVEGPAQTEIGAVCRWRSGGEDYTAAAVSASGSYRFWQVRGGVEHVLADWAPSDLLQGVGVGQHRIGLECAGSDLTLTFDGSRVGDATDPDPVSGDAGLLAGLAGTPPLQVTFDDFQVTR
jgi:hypothetical protein